jgi:hypothetical protein
LPVQYKPRGNVISICVHGLGATVSRCYTVRGVCFRHGSI